MERLVWNSRFDDVRPRAVARVADAADVGKVVEFARDNGLRLSARSGAHSFAGYSTGDELIVDLSGLVEVEVEPGAERARLGAGATTLPTYRALWRHKMAVPGGTCPTVGLTGLAAGGGLGVLSRRNGLTCDSLLEVEVVTADGQLLCANGGQNDDLYWAIRGAGGGNFGIVTALTFALVPVDTPFTYTTYQFPWSAAEDLIAAWQAWLPTSPARTASDVALETSAPHSRGTPVAELEVVHAGPEREERAIVADLLAAVGASPSSRVTDAGPFVEVEKDSYCKGLRPKECNRRQVARGAVPASCPLREVGRRLGGVAAGRPQRADRVDRATSA